MDLKILPGVSTQTYVVQGAKLSCILGTSSGTLQLPMGHGVLIKGKKQINIMDFKPMLNITTFCTCNLTVPPTPCVPTVVAPWLNGKMDVLIDNMPALLSGSIAFCARGGVIRITNDGQ